MNEQFAARMVLGLMVSGACGLLLGRAVMRHDWLGACLALAVSIFVALAHGNNLMWKQP